MRIGITYNLKSDLPVSGGKALPEDAGEEFDPPETIEAIRGVLEEEGDETVLLGGGPDFVEKLRKHRVDFVFNIAEGHQGRSREGQIPGLLEMLGIPYSGSDATALGLTLDKSLAKRMAISLGIPTPEFWVLDEENETQIVPDQFPLFVKPLWQGSSIGIRRSSRVEDRASLEREVARLFQHYPHDPVLVEEYIAGQEVTVGLLGPREPELLGMMEITFQDSAQKDFCYSLEVKRRWKEEVEYHVPARIDPATGRGIESSALRLFKVLRLRDLARFDFRVNSRKTFYFLEVNPLPGLNPESGDLVILARKKGWSYRDLVLKIVRSAISRYPRLAPISQ